MPAENEQVDAQRAGGSASDARNGGSGHGRRGARRLLWVGCVLLAVIVLFGAGVAWVLNTESGTQWAANRAVGFLNGRLELGQISGALAGPLTVNGIRWADPESGVDVRVARVTVDVALPELLSSRAHVRLLDVNGVDVRLSEPTKKDDESKPFSLKPPIDVLLDKFTLKDARVSRDGTPLFVARAAEASASWTGKGLAIQRFIVDSPDGNVRLNGEVSGDKVYDGRLSGGFRWKVADAQYAGELSATSQTEKLNALIRLSSPFAARINVTLGETKELPWQLTLDVPSFDPRKEWLRDSSIESLAASLNAHGDLTFAELRGDVSINGKALRIDPARVRLKEQVLTIEALTLLDPTRRGSLSATGQIEFASNPNTAAPTPSAAREVTPNAPSPTRPQPGAPSPEPAGAPAPFNANLNVTWKDVELPKEWVGQPLATHGDLKVIGSTATFTADGQMALGPPGKLADIALAVAGTPEQVQVKRFEILQKTGSLAATGTVLIKPRIGWQLAATAKTFDPGAIVAGWPGKLGFALDTKGELLEQGPNASLNLKNLNGTLRNRPIAGEAALTVNPQKVVAGNLKLSSGRSSVSVTGRAGQSMNVDTELNVASLDDWAPQTAGRVTGKFHISGAWPKLAVEGNAQGRDIAFGKYSVKTLDVKADIHNPQSPSGSVTLNASTLIAAGFEFSSIELDASGDEKAHTAHLKAKGEPLSAELRVQGAREGKDGWAGTVEQLDLAATGVPPLSLREPAKVTFNPRAFSVSQSCLAGDQLSACITAAQNEAGELNAKYTLEHLPLGLIAALAAPDLPLRIEAVIEGSGDIRRTKEGAFFGEAHISSTSGRVSEASAAAQEDAADALLTYKNLKVDAQLAGETAQGSLSGSLNNGGTLSGEVRLANLSGASPSIDGAAKLSIPDLSPIGLFVPQLSNIKGSGEANAKVTGTIAEPQITGTAQLRELAAEVPQIGLKLHDGEVNAEIGSGNALKITGKLGSGSGQVTIDGDTSTAGVLSVKVQGKDFLAADMPGANVVIAPDVTFQRSKESMLLFGRVVISKAAVDISKLPKQQSATQASADVVVIDDDNKAIEQSKSVPLEVNVALIFNKNERSLAGYGKDDVTLIGYGLNATVDGWLDVHEREGSPTTANGEIHLNGLYKAYGQDLTIEQGRLLFGGQSIDDPTLNLIATRTVESTKAILTVSGSAKKPQLEVSADPTKSQTDALSYLVTGKPINEVGTGEGDLVQSAARSLGGAAGNLLAKGLGKRLGINDIGVQDSDAIGGGSAFTVGQYLSPRLYLSYGVGLFEPGQVVTLRYRLSEKVSLEAVQGTLNQKAGINYRIEK
ncbi:MAG: translocation/assembly module TamB domain-containing protein [Gammaproteobacteria bacterium]